MRYVKDILRSLLALPSRIRMALVGLAFLACAILFVLGFPSRLNGSLLSVPVVLAAWLFRRRGVIVVLAITTLLLWYVNTITYHTLLWPPSALTPFVAGLLALYAEAWLISYLRSTLELSDAARRQAQQAEYQLARAYEQQKQLNDLKDQLLIHLNHELRTPLTGMRGYLELLSEFGPQISTEKYGQFLHNAIRGCDELQEIIENVLCAMQASAIGTPLPAEQGENIPLLDLIQGLLELFDPCTREEHPVYLDIPEQLTLCANVHYTRQVLQNLLSNAFKYSPHGSPVSVRAVSCSADSSGAAMVEISVKDAGPGIPPDELPLLFGQFVRLRRDVSSPIRGTGLGLYISKQLVEAMGGRIWAESTGIPGEGSRFFVMLPSAPQTLVPPSEDTVAKSEVEQN